MIAQISFPFNAEVIFWENPSNAFEQITMFKKPPSATKKTIISAPLTNPWIRAKNKSNIPKATISFDLLSSVIVTSLHLRI